MPDVCKSTVLEAKSDNPSASVIFCTPFSFLDLWKCDINLRSCTVVAFVYYKDSF